jgi:4-amino-4-deoxy-L-arabinose transferase-like glycosyltransferase
MESMVNRAASPDRSGVRGLPAPFVVFAFFLVNVAAWMIYAELSRGVETIHEDVAEAYAWGREFQLGYFKHPPFWSWIAGIWFWILPHRNWAFSLLAVLNANIGLWGAWKLIGRFAGAEKHVVATILLLLTPFYTFLCFKYNANSIFLSLWPWTAYFFVRSIDERRPWHGVMFGVLAAADILSKYFAVVLLATCLIAALVHPERRKYFASAAPYLAIGVAALLIAPHIWWLVTTGFQPFHYLDSETHHTLGFSVQNALRFLLGAALFHLVIAIIVLLAKPMPWRRWVAAIRERSRDPRFRFLAVLCLAPCLLTAIAGPLIRLKLSTNMTIGIFCLVPLLLIEIAAITDWRRAIRLAFGSVGLLTVGALCVAPFIPYALFADGRPTAVDPRQEIAAEATRIWRQVTGTPLAIVTGVSPYPGAATFYSEDQPSQLIDFNFTYSPWLTPETVARRGLLAICPKGNARCLASAAKFATPETVRREVTLTHDLGDRRGPPVSFVLVIVPPRQ